MIDSQILQPVVVLLGWTMVMWLWMYATRIPAMSRAGLDPNEARETGVLDERLPQEVQWKAHNYNHLHEQPTVFYAIALLLALVGWGDGMNALLAWIYVGLRVIHSLVQATGNVVLVRFVLFALSSLVLIALIVHAAMAVFDIHSSGLPPGPGGWPASVPGRLAYSAAWRSATSSVARKRSASSAAMQPIPAAVTAWR